MFTLARKEPFWLTLFEAGEIGAEEPAVRILVRPVDRPMRRAAARASRPALEGVDFQAEQFADVDLLRMVEAGELGAEELLRNGIVDWEGVGDAAGKPVPATPENIELALADDQFFTRAEERYVKEAAKRDREKNGLAASPNGTGEAAIPANGTASSRAAGTATSAAKAASTRKTPSRPRKRKRSGTS